MIRSHCCLTVSEIAEEDGISKTMCHEILNENLGMHSAETKFVLSLLSEDRNKIVLYSKELIDCASAGENFYKNIVTGDETWVYGYDVKTKAQSSQWVSTMSPRPKKAQQVQSNVNVILIVFFDCEGIKHHKFLLRSQTVNKEYYLR